MLKDAQKEKKDAQGFKDTKSEWSIKCSSYKAKPKGGSEENSSPVTK